MIFKNIQHNLTKKHRTLILILILSLSFSMQSQRRKVELLKDWKFSHEDSGATPFIDFDDQDWENITLPHDWAILGDFNFKNDLQLTKVVQDGDKKPKYRTGRTGALPYVGVGWYRTHFRITEQEAKERVELSFDGAMSNTKVYVNGKFVGERPNGYVSFYFDITSFLNQGDNLIAVRLENFPGQSRWYPGAGLYRKVTLVKTSKTHIKTWGTFVTTPEISSKKAKVDVELELVGNGDYTLENKIIDPKGNISVIKTTKVTLNSSTKISQDLIIKKPELWSLKTPQLYQLETTLLKEETIIDKYTTPFGIRSIRFELNGFYLNDKKISFQGVNMHHDLGPVGAAFYPELFLRQVKKLKEMGVNAIRFSHNPPAPEALDICDAEGILVIDEAFDEWEINKTDNGYGKYFDKWAQKDITNTVLRDRNHPSVIMWSLGNEVQEQFNGDPKNRCKFLNDIVKKIDTTRATTVGFSKVVNSLKYGMAQTVDVAGFNYRAGIYHKIRELYPNLKFYASETGGSLSVRGAYKFPVIYDHQQDKKGRYADKNLYKDGHPGNYENTSVPWGYSPYKEFAAQDYNPFVYGEFVWTGYDYLGEPSPYNNAQGRSSYFAPIDMVGLEKDKFYLYQSQWNKEKDVLHVLPHWTLPKMKGKKIPVICHTNFEKAELFINGKSYGVKGKEKPLKPDFLSDDINIEINGGTSFNQVKAYSIVWENVMYEYGTLKVVAYNAKNEKVAEKTIVTADKPSQIKIMPELNSIKQGQAGVYQVSVVDKNGNLCPNYNENMQIEVSGAARFLASGNGDPMNLQNLSKPERKFLNGKAVVYIKSIDKGTVNIKVTSGNSEAINTELVVK
ncbi:glycoside hydrolase family 2 TIM barrel-domain containing protein [Aquimarina algicola]|nr:glycoside hydrolase family 2 TIM barrel-domain containing protein [Aquimarina algicola]